MGAPERSDERSRYLSWAPHRGSDVPSGPEAGPGGGYVRNYAAMLNSTVNRSPSTIGALRVWKGRQRAAS